MDEERMMRLVTAEVLKVLRQSGFVNAAVQPPTKMIAVFTGGMIGIQEAFAALRQLQAQGAELTAVLSPAAEKVIGIAALQENLGEGLPVITEVTSPIYDLISQTDLVVVPVLTQNSLAKVVHLMYDTVATETILRALQFGKKVIAARNAADPLDPYRIQTGMARGGEKLLHKMQEYLRQVQQYGVTLVAAKELAGTVQQVLRNDVAQLPAIPQQEGADRRKNANGAKGKPILDATQVQQAIDRGESRLVLVPGSLVTPLAKEKAQEAGLEIVIN